MPAAVNTDVNGWCPTCTEWSVRGRHGQCMWCDTPLTDGGGRFELPARVLRVLVADALDRMGQDAQEEQEARQRALSERREAIEAKRLATMRANGTRRGTGLLRISEDVLREAHELYWTGHNEEGRPLSVRRVAAIIMPRTGYASAASCAECLHKAWKARGWPLRDRIEAARAATITHGELIGTKDWRDPVAAEKKNEYRRRRRALDPTYARGKQATTTKGGPDGPRNHQQGHDDERAQEALAWPGGRARNEAA